MASKETALIREARDPRLQGYGDLSYKIAELADALEASLWWEETACRQREEWRAEATRLANVAADALERERKLSTALTEIAGDTCGDEVGFARDVLDRMEERI